MNDALSVRTLPGRQLEPLVRSPRLRPLGHDPELGRGGRGKKAQRRIDREHLDWVLADFSGYIAADELYDGPFCILSLVDNRTFKRIAYQVLNRDPTQDDITAFFRRFQAALEQRGLTLRGITTDGSSLYPVPIAAVFGEVPHQLGTFHVLRELTKAVLGAVAKVRKDLAARKPKLKARPPDHEGGAGGGPAKEAARAEDRRPIRASLLVRPASAQPRPAADVAADQPGLAPAPDPACAHGGGVSALRPAVPDRHGLGQADAVAASCPPVPPRRPGAEDAVLAQSGEGVDVPG